MNSIKNILIIGGNGYIGTKLQTYLQNHNVDIMDPCFENNTNTKYKNYYQNYPKEIFENFHVIILLGGQSSVSSSENLDSVLQNNIVNFANLLNNLLPSQMLIYSSSSSAYGNTLNKEVDENYTDYTPYNYYDWSKKSIDDLAIMSNKHYYGLRFGTVNGYSQNLRNDLMINSMVNNAKNNNQIIVSNKHINRPILGINDLCKGIVQIINNGSIDKSGIYNMNSFNSTVDQISQKVADYLNVQIVNVENITGDILNYKLQTKMYDFKITSKKFSETFNFTFNDTIDTIIQDLTSNLNEDNYTVISNRKLDTFQKNYNNNCNVCMTLTNELLDLGMQPLANNLNKIQNDISQEFPLCLHYCPNCFHVQLNYVVNPAKLFQNYLYVSGTSNTLKQYFKNFAIYAIEQYLNTNTITDDIEKIKVLDIACNDTSQLDAFKDLMEEIVETVGVDPARNIYDTISKYKNHDIICDFFNKKTVDILQNKYKKFDIIIAQNVFAHINYLSQFLQYCKTLLTDNGTLYIQTSQKDMILNHQFDTAYHEHLNFFNSNSMNLLCKNNGLVLNNVYEHDIHGTSYIFSINKYATPKETNITSILEIETENGLYNHELYKNYRILCSKYKNNLCNLILTYHLNNKIIIGYGCTAKSMTVLNYCGLTNKDISYIIDENSLKHDLYTPKSNIQIKPFSFLETFIKNHKEIVIIINAWNFYDEIKNKILKSLSCITDIHKIILLNLNTLQDEFL